MSLIHWALRALVAASLSIVLLIDLYHFLVPSSLGIPSWVMPLVPFMVLMGPISLVWLVVEALAVLRTRSRKGPLLVDAAVVATWLIIWFAHL